MPARDCPLEKNRTLEAARASHIHTWLFSRALTSRPRVQLLFLPQLNRSSRDCAGSVRTESNLRTLILHHPNNEEKKRERERRQERERERCGRWTLMPTDCSEWDQNSFSQPCTEKRTGASRRSSFFSLPSSSVGTWFRYAKECREFQKEAGGKSSFSTVLIPSSLDNIQTGPGRYEPHRIVFVITVAHLSVPRFSSRLLLSLTDISCFLFFSYLAFIRES